MITARYWLYSFTCHLFNSVLLPCFYAVHHSYNVWATQQKSQFLSIVVTAPVLLRYNGNEINKPLHSNGHVPVVAHVEGSLTSNTKFLRLTLVNTFSWKKHIDTIVPKLSWACSAVRAVKPFFIPRISEDDILLLSLHNVLFWGNSYHSNTVFKLQKRIIIIMVEITSRESCREYFRKLKVLPLQSQYMYLLLSFVINNRQLL
jgi:hypothetical protein